LIYAGNSFYDEIVFYVLFCILIYGGVLMKNLTLFVVLGLLFSTGAVFAAKPAPAAASNEEAKAEVTAAGNADVAPKKDGVCKRVKNCITSAAGKTKNHVSGHKLAYGLGSAAVVAAVAGVWYLLHDKQEEQPEEEAAA
jgi:hypothetical protein